MGSTSPKRTSIVRPVSSAERALWEKRWKGCRIQRLGRPAVKWHLLNMTGVIPLNFPEGCLPKTTQVNLPPWREGLTRPYLQFKSCRQLVSAGGERDAVFFTDEPPDRLPTPRSALHSNPIWLTLKAHFQSAFVFMDVLKHSSYFSAFCVSPSVNHLLLSFAWLEMVF